MAVNRMPPYDYSDAVVGDAAETSHCNGCGKDLPLTDANWLRRANGKPRRPCRCCTRERIRAYAKKNSARIAQRARDQRAGKNTRGVALPVAPDPPDAEPVPARPRTRGGCENGIRPCPFLTCSMHLAVDVNKYGNIVARKGLLRIENGMIELDVSVLDEMKETCALDVAARGEHSLEEIGELFGLTRERIRQLHDDALDLVRARARREGWS